MIAAKVLTSSSHLHDCSKGADIILTFAPFMFAFTGT
jgi:hypothetical protein